MVGRIKMFDIKFLCDESPVPQRGWVLDAYKICKEYIEKCDLEQVVKNDCLAELYNNFEGYNFDAAIKEFGVDAL